MIFIEVYLYVFLHTHGIVTTKRSARDAAFIGLIAKS